MRRLGSAFVIGLCSAASVACGSGGSAGNGETPRTWECLTSEGDEPDALAELGCERDFLTMASEPADASLPGALSVKTIIDRVDENRLYFQNSSKYPLHYNYASKFLSGVDDLPAVGDERSFNENYYDEQRRFILGTVTHYEGPDKWAFQVSPYDTASVGMLVEAFEIVRDAAYFGADLYFHPSSLAAEAAIPELETEIPVITTDELYEGIDYQPLNLGEVVGPIKFLRSSDLDEVYLSARDIVVLDSVPNDISPVAGIITEEFQTPLSHINVLARTRGTPNMGLKNARENSKLASLEDGQNVRLTVGAFGWDLVPATLEETETYWAEHPFPMVTVPKPDLTVTDLRDIELVTEHTDTPPYVTFEAIQAATRQFGAKTANYSVFSTDAEVPSKEAFGIPVFYYHQFMTQNGIFDRIEELEATPAFLESESVRDEELAKIREAVMTGEVDSTFSELLRAKLDEKFPGRSVRFRSSTNAEDLDGFPCAGCYDSHTGDPSEFDGDQLAAALDAIKRTWATVWNLRTYEERRIHGMVHSDVCMALLVHTNFPNEEANGVAVTNNIFDTSGNAPAFYVNVQLGGEAEVVHPPPGITTDSFLYHFTFAGQPVIYYSHSNLIPEGETVLSTTQIHELGVALDRVHKRFASAYQTSPSAWYGLEVDFKFDDEADPGGPPALYIKQARPYPSPAQ